MKLKTFILTFLMILSGPILFGQNGDPITVYSRVELENALNGDHGWYPQIKLGQSFGVSKRVDVKAGVTATLDLNGYTLSADNKTYVLNNLGNLTIKDSSTEGTGTIEGRGIYNGSHGSVDYTDLAAVLTIESGIFKNTGTNGGAAVYNLGTANINGGTFYGEYAALHNRLAVMHIKNVYIIGKTINSYGDFRNSGALYIGENVYFYGKYSEENNGSHSGEFTYLVAKIDNAYYATLQDAIDNAKTGETVTLIADCAGDVTVTQAPNYAITIDGAEKTFKGTITVDGKSARYETTALTIKNVNFDATEGISADACINLGAEGNNNTRYTNKVTVENCTFTDNDYSYSSVAVKSYTGGDHNLVVKGCEANGMHSLAQLKNIEQGLVISGNIANTKNGINLNQTAVGTIEGNEINVKGYAVRIGESTGGNITLNGNTLKTDNTEGDPVIELRGTVVALNMEKNVVSGDTHIKGTAGTISVDANYWDGEEAPVVAEGSAPIVVNSYYADEALTTLVRIPMGNDFTAYTREDAIWGEVWGNATESFVIKVLDANGNVMGTTSLNNIGGIIDGDVNVTWSLKLDAASNTDGYWAMEWTTAPSIDNMPAKVELYVDGTRVGGGDVVLNAPDNLKKINAAVIDNTGKILKYKQTLGEAIADSDNVAILVAGTYNVPTGKNLTITGAVDGVVFDMSQAVGVNSSMTFNNVTFEYTNANYKGLQHAGAMAYNNCTINGQVFLYGTSETFNNCTFNQNSADAYNVWTYGAKEVVFNKCTFNSAGKSVLIYSEQSDLVNNLTVTDCDFIASSPVEGKAAIEMDSSLTAGINLTIDGETTATGFDEGNVSGKTLWNNKKGNNNDANNDITVVVAGETVLEPIYEAQIGEEGHRTLQEAIGKAVAGDNTIQLLADITGDVTILQQEGINIVIDGKNYTFNGTINIYGNARHTGEETLTIQNVNFYTEDNARYFIEANEYGQIPETNNFKQYAHNVTVQNCNFSTSAENTENEVVGMRFRQAYNVSAVNCTSDGIFSIMWTTAVDGLTLNGVEATNCEEGITIGGASKEVEIIGTTIYSETYAIRAEGAGSDFTIENSTLEAKVPVVVRSVTDNSKISFTFDGTNTITKDNPAGYWFVAGKTEYKGGENEQLPETAGQVSVTLNDTNLNREGIYGSALNGEGTENNPYLIETVNDLVFFREKVNGGNNYAGKHVKLAADIDLSSIENWTPIGDITYNGKYQPADSTKVFSGVFNGNDKVISNLKIEKIIDEDPDTDANVGLFGITGKGAVIKNLTLTNVDIKTSGRNVGALAGFAYKATLDNITVNGDINIEGGNNVSGVVSMTRYYAMSATNIKVVGNDGSTIVGNNIVGGIFAEIAPNGSEQTFKNLSVENVAINGVGGVGGIVGLLSLGTVEDVTVKNVALTGNTLYQGNTMGRIRLGSVAGLMGGQYATIANVTTENVTAKNLDGDEVVLPIIGANYGAASNATEARIGDTYYATLQTAINKANNDETIELLANVNNNVTFTAVSAKELTLDLNGYTITSEDNSTITVSNGNHVIIKDPSEPSTGMIVSTADNCEAIAVKDNGNVTFVSGTAYHPVNGVYLYTAGDNNKFTMTGGTIKVDDNGIVLTVSTGEATVKDGNLLIENMNQGGISALAFNGTINIEGGNISNIAKVETGWEGKVSITGGTFTFANNETFVKGTIAPFHYAVENENGTFTVIKNDVVLNGTGVENDPYLISNVNELMWFRDYVNLNGTEVHAALTNNIDMSDLRWVSIGTSDKKFTGTFDGRNNTLSNLNADDNQCGLFRYTHNATVKNLTIENVTVIEPLQDHNGTGAVIGVGSGTTRVENITVKGKIAVAGKRAGAIVGYVYSGLYAENCHVIGSGIDESYVNAFYWASGGIIGFSAPVDGHSEIKNCSVKDIKIWAEHHYGAGAIAGTFKGLLEDVTAENVNVIGKYSEESNGLLCGYQKATGNSYAINSTLTVGDAVIENPRDIVAKIGDNKMFCTLQAALNAAQDGETIKLIADEIFTEDNRTNSSGTWYEGVYYVGNKNFTIDLNDYTVTQNGAVNDYMFLFKNDGEKDNTITLKNGTIDAGTAAFCAFATTSSNVNKMTINTEDINFVGNNSGGAVLKIRGGTELNVKAGTVITGNNNYVGIEAYGNGTVVNINEGAEIYQKGKSSYVGSLVGASGNATVNVYGGKGTSAKGGFIAMTSGGTINVSGGEWTANTNGATANDNNAVLIAQSDKQYNAGAGNSIVNVSGGVFKGGYNCYGNAVGDAQINISGGIFSVNPSDYCAENYGAFPYDENSWVVRMVYGTQEFTLTAGWNWMSSYISEFDKVDEEGKSVGLSMLVNALGDNGIQIKNNLGAYTYGGSHYGWSGNLTATSVKEMYKVNVTADVTFEFEGGFVNYDELEIPLYPGWNYIGYPVDVTTNIADALIISGGANFMDVIKSQNGTSTYAGEDTGWLSSDFFTLIPGEGYMYQNTSGVIKTLKYSTKVTTTTSNNRNRNHWTVDATQYPSNMTMIATVDVEGGDYEVAAFVNGEVRGSARPIYVEELDAHILILTISGNDVEEMTFMYYNIATGEEVELSNRINYSNDAIVGSIAEPYILTRGTTGIGEASMSEISIYPNPTTTGTAINLQATCDRVEVYNALGVKVAEYQNVDSIDAIETAGIYVIRITNDGNVQNCRLVVK